MKQPRHEGVECDEAFRGALEGPSQSCAAEAHYGKTYDCNSFVFYMLTRCWKRPPLLGRLAARWPPEGAHLLVGAQRCAILARIIYCMCNARDQRI